MKKKVKRLQGVLVYLQRMACLDLTATITLVILNKENEYRIYSVWMITYIIQKSVKVHLFKLGAWGVLYEKVII